MVAGSTYPGRDYGWVDVNANWTPRPWVKYYSTQLPVHNANVAAQGASVCRSGWRTGWRCGTIEARNVTVNFPEGHGQPIDPDQRLRQLRRLRRPVRIRRPGPGRTLRRPRHRWTDGCYADTHFQPVRPILAKYGLNLLVTGGSLPTVRNMTCDYHGNNTLGCVMNHVTQGSAQITWTVGGVPRTDWNNKTIVSGSCGGTISGVSVTVTNSAGSWTEARTVQCEGSPQ